MAEQSESGYPILRHPPATSQWTPPHFGEPEHLDKVQSHVERYFGTVELVFHEIMSDRIHLDVLYVKPTTEKPFHTFVTMDMSNIPMTATHEIEGGPYAELMNCLPKEWKVPDKYDVIGDPETYAIYWLKTLARFPHEHNTWLGSGHTIPNGDPAQPFAPNTEMSTMLVLEPVGVDKDFWELRVSDDKSIKFFNLVPLYAEETQLKLNKGMEALLEKLEQHGASLVMDAARPNTCKKKRWPCAK